MIVEDVLQKAQKCEVDKQQKMLLSLRSNSQTMKPYIQKMMICAPEQSITCLLPIVLHMAVFLCPE